MAIIDERYQLVTGTVAPSGDVLVGEGFKARQIKYGTYLVEFERPFAQDISPVCTIVGNEWQTFNLSIAILDVSNKYFICSTSNPNQPVDCAFNFSVFGEV
ncbi:MAG: hypothetical protein F6J87_15690 [Spirulina sp. SIO3F2]|nr:hypothetical protein [Spirulina sp. SIO3F2]